MSRSCGVMQRRQPSSLLHFMIYMSRDKPAFYFCRHGLAGTRRFCERHHELLKGLYGAPLKNHWIRRCAIVSYFSNVSSNADLRSVIKKGGDNFSSPPTDQGKYVWTMCLCLIQHCILVLGLRDHFYFSLVKRCVQN